MEIAKAAFDFAFGLSIRSDAVGDVQGGQCALKLGMSVEPIGGGLMAEEAQAVGVEGGGAAVCEEDEAQQAEVIPGGVGRDEDAAEHLAGVVVEGEDEALEGVGGPPAMRG